ncbi:GNAT family N-acetyltransferase [Salipaludibacillus keqinensis]|nr:GNAT family N-acetyltransferase [Salipaludibacillus keqinensis]
MTTEAAHEIAQWQYDPPYELYSMDGSIEVVTELVGSQYYLVSTNDCEVFGYFCLGEEARVPGGYEAQIYDDLENFVDLGLGIHPKFTSKGLGKDFMFAILDWVRIHTKFNNVRLVVATFNERAIRVYEKAGFIRREVFFTKVGSTDLPFIEMTRSTTLDPRR